MAVSIIVLVTVLGALTAPGLIALSLEDRRAAKLKQEGA